jgi:hypothetical protein
MKRKQHHTPVKPLWSRGHFRILIAINCWFCRGWSKVETLLRILFQNLPVRGRL